MEKLVDYTKYTIAVSLGLFLYIPANFIPAPSNWAWMFLATLMFGLTFSIGCGIMLYTRATKILIEDVGAAEDQKGYTNMWGRLHLWSLLIAFVCIAPYFGYHKVWAPTAEAECSVELPLANDEIVKVAFSCKAEPKQTIDSSRENEDGS